jgi:small subunit ribosomal protein S4e
MKLCKVKSRAMGPKGIPYVVTHDGRTIRFPDPKIKRNDTIKLNLKTNEITNVYKFAVGQSCMVTKGNNIGRCGNVIRVEKHEGSYEIIHIRDENKTEFSTRLTNVFITGNATHEVGLLKRHNKLTILQERDIRHKRRPVLENEDEEE